jgi:hypothetical protein
LDGVTKKQFSLIPESTTSDAYVISTIYDVDQENRLISNLSYGVSVDVFKSNVEAVIGATYDLEDNAGFERTTGTVHFDDVIIVVSEDGSMSRKYYLTFLSEDDADIGTAVKEYAVFDQSKLQVYPVPANDVMTVKLEDDNISEFTFSVFSMTGSRVYKETVFGNQTDLDVQQFKNGAYIIFIDLEGTTYKKLVID